MICAGQVHRVPFSDVILLDWSQEGRLACRKPVPTTAKVLLQGDQPGLE